MPIGRIGGQRSSAMDEHLRMIMEAQQQSMNESMQRRIDQEYANVYVPQDVSSDTRVRPRASTMQFARTSTYSTLDGMNVWELVNPYANAPDPNAGSQIQIRRAREKEQFELFLASGMPTENIRLVENNGKLIATGYQMGDTNRLFKITDRAIVAQKKRTRHLKALLEKLAEMEGKELVLQDNPPTVDGSTRSVMYYAFANRPDTDDSALVNACQPLRVIPERSLDDEHGGGCDCSEYCSDCDSHECECDSDDYPW